MPPRLPKNRAGHRRNQPCDSRVETFSSILPTSREERGTRDWVQSSMINDLVNRIYVIKRRLGGAERASYWWIRGKAQSATFRENGGPTHILHILLNASLQMPASSNLTYKYKHKEILVPRKIQTHMASWQSSLRSPNILWMNRQTLPNQEAVYIYHGQ